MDDFVSIKSITWTKSHKDENDNIDESKQDGWGKVLYRWNSWHANEQLSKWFNNIVHFYNPCKSSRL
jgi:hypothetical protein